MLLSLWMMTQFVLLTLLVVFGTSQPQSPVQAILLGAVGVLALAPALTAFVCARRRVFVLALPQCFRRQRSAIFRSFSLPQDPGTAGAALPRAPSHACSALG